MCGFNGARSVEGETKESPIARYALEMPDNSGDRLRRAVEVCSEVDSLRAVCASRNTLKVRLLRAVPRARRSVYGIGSISSAALMLASLDDDRIAMEMGSDDLISAAEDLLECAMCDCEHASRVLLLRAAQSAVEQLNGQSEDRIRMSRRLASTATFLKMVRALNETRASLITPLQAKALSLRVAYDRSIVLGLTDSAPSSLLQQPQIVEKLHFNAAKQLLTRQAGIDMHRLSTALFPLVPSLPVRFEGAAALSVLCKAKELGIRFNDHESNLHFRAMALLRLKDIDGVLQLLGNWGVDFELRSRVVSLVVQVPGGADKVAASSSESAFRAFLRGQAQVEKLERWLISFASNKGLSQDKRVRASYDRALLLLEKGLLSPLLERSLEETAIFILEAARELETAGREAFANQTREYLNLTRAQAEYKLRPGRGVCHSISECVALGREEVAEKLRKDFKVSDRFYFKARVRGFGWKGRWLDAAKLASTDTRMAKHCPVLEILDMCLESGNDAQAVLIASELLKDDEPEKARTFAKVRMWPETLKFGAISRCAEALNEMSLRCRDPELALQARRLAEEAKKANQSIPSSRPTGILGVVAGVVRAEPPNRCQQQ
jgi:hypothetical protein